MLKLFRDTSTGVATTGYFDVQPHRIFTLERPWVPIAGAPCGQKGVSCVPPGTYRLVPHDSEAHPNTVALVNEALWVYHFEEHVPTERRGLARTAVLIHPANYVSELRGCIAPGFIRGGGLVPEVHESRKAFAQLALEWPAEIEIVGLAV